VEIVVVGHPWANPQPEKRSKKIWRMKSAGRRKESCQFFGWFVCHAVKCEHKKSVFFSTFHLPFVQSADEHKKWGEEEGRRRRRMRLYTVNFHLSFWKKKKARNF
jgi:hypothetical protein